jgi:pimeloyl-ACP methyl ester carboxylesterase
MKAVRVLCVILLALLAAASLPRAQEPEAGKVVPAVTCRTDPKHAFALYLPKGYAPEKKWPLLLCFSPDGRPEVPVGLLREACEAYGFIAVGSRNSTNGPWPPIVNAYDVLWKEVGARFAVDPARVYGVGFSGGARAALHFALAHPDRFAGVLSCGAFGAGTQYVPKNCKLALYTCIGRDDFNYYEVRRADRSLEGRAATRWVQEMDGGHRWPTAEILRGGIAFFQAVAMREGILPRDEALLSAQAQARLVEADRLEGAGRKLEATRMVRGVATYFAPGDEAASRARTLEADPEVKQALALEVKYEEVELQLRAIADPDKYMRLVKGFEAKRQGGGPEAEHAGRLLAIASTQLQERGTALLREGSLKEAALCLETSASLFPGQPLPAYNATCVFSRMGKKKEALEYLNRAVANGFRDAELLRRDTDLDKIRKEPEFAEILSRVEGTR